MSERKGGRRIVPPPEPAKEPVKKHHSEPAKAGSSLPAKAGESAKE